MTFDDMVKFLEKAGVYYLATDNEGEPEVRPFGTVNVFNGKLYIQTGKKKKVSQELHSNPKCAICAMYDGSWLRINAEAVEDDSREARKSMLDKYPDLRNMYDEDDGNTEVFYLENGRALLSSFSASPEEIIF